MLSSSPLSIISIFQVDNSYRLYKPFTLDESLALSYIIISYFSRFLFSFAEIINSIGCQLDWNVTMPKSSIRMDPC